MEERLTELETRISYQDKIIDDLNNVVIELRKEVNLLRAQYNKVRESLEDDNIKDADQETKPPHY